MSLKKIAKSDFVKVPWANGLGVTTELHTEKSSCTTGYQWRLSIADITQNGPFSILKNVERFHMLYRGEGSYLKFLSGRSEHLNTLYQSIHFSGDSALECSLLDGPIQALNFIYNPEVCSMHAEIINISHIKTIDLNTSNQNLLVSLDSGFQIRADDSEIYLESPELIISKNEARISVIGEGNLLIIKVNNS